MQVRPHIILAYVGLSMFGLLLPPVYAQSNSFIYQNTEYGISMPYPAGWYVQESGYGHEVLFTSPPQSPSDIAPEFLSIYTEDLKPCSRHNFRRVCTGNINGSPRDSSQYSNIWDNRSNCTFWVPCIYQNVYL